MEYMRRIKVNVTHFLSVIAESSSKGLPTALSVASLSEAGERPNPQFPNIAQMRKRRLLRRMLIEELR